MGYQPDQNPAEIIRLYGHFLDSYIAEANPVLSKEQLLADMNIYPIVSDGKEIGVVGINTAEMRGRRTAIIRIMFVAKEHRGKSMGPIIDGLLQKFQELGFTHAEGWSYTAYAKHIAKRYGIQPKIVIFHESLDYLLGQIAARKKQKT